MTSSAVDHLHIQFRGAGFESVMLRLRVSYCVLRHRGQIEGVIRAGKKCQLVDNIGARLGSEANFGSHKIKIFFLNSPSPMIR